MILVEPIDKLEKLVLLPSVNEPPAAVNEAGVIVSVTVVAHEIVEMRVNNNATNKFLVFIVLYVIVGRGVTRQLAADVNISVLVVRLNQFRLYALTGSD